MRAILLIMISLSLLYAEITRDAATGIVSDSATGLEWQDSEVGALLSWQSAINRCETLVLGGHSDWRLPNINELKSIVDREVNPTIKIGFVNTAASYYWSSTTGDGYEHLAWVLNFSHGFVSGAPKIYGDYVRCVRSGE